MKNKILLCGSIIVIMALMIAFGYTNAKYYSTASMTGDLDFVKTVGKISIYHPEWSGGYEGPDNGSGIFNVPQVPTVYPSICYRVTNKIDDVLNEEETSYYIRVVAEDGTNNIPIEYNVHEFVHEPGNEHDNPNNIYDKVEGIGYGPFTLGVGLEETQYYSLKVNWTSKNSAYVKDIQHLKVQIVKKRIDGTLKVIDEAPLNMQYSGKKNSVTFAYYLYGTNPSTPIGDSQTLDMKDNCTIDFTNNDELAELGIIFPTGYTFHDIRYGFDETNKDWTGTATSVTFPQGDTIAEYRIEVYFISNTEVPIQIKHYNYINTTLIDSVKTVIVNRGITIDFTNNDKLAELGITLPTGYTFHDIRYQFSETNKDWSGTATSVTIPNIPTDPEYSIDVYMKPAGTATVNLSYYDSKDTLLSSQSLSNVPVGTVIDFKDSSSLVSLGINLPNDYKFNTAYCNELDNTGTGHNDFTIPYEGANKTYHIKVVVEKIINVITVPVKFYKDGVEGIISETTVNMNGDGTYTFTTDICRELCPDLNTMTSFTIYIANQWGSTYDNVGNTSTSATVTVDYNKTYTSWADFKLTDPGSYIYIKAWW